MLKKITAYLAGLMLKTTFKVSIIAVVSVFLALFLIPFFYSWEDLAPHALPIIKEKLGMDVKVDGGFSFSIIPPRVHLDSVKAKQGNVEVLAAKKIHAKLKFWPLLVGTVRVDTLTIENANVLVRRDKLGDLNWHWRQSKGSVSDDKKAIDSDVATEKQKNAIPADHLGQAKKAIQSAQTMAKDYLKDASFEINLHAIQLQDSQVHYIDEKVGKDLTFSDINVVFNVETLSGPYRLQGGLIIDDTPLLLNMYLASNVLHKPTPMQLIVQSKALKTEMRMQGDVKQVGAEAFEVNSKAGIRVDNFANVKKFLQQKFDISVPSHPLLNGKFEATTAANIGYENQAFEAEFKEFVLQLPQNVKINAQANWVGKKIELQDVVMQHGDSTNIKLNGHLDMEPLKYTGNILFDSKATDTFIAGIYKPVPLPQQLSFEMNGEFTQESIAFENLRLQNGTQEITGGGNIVYQPLKIDTDLQSKHIDLQALKLVQAEVRVPQPTEGDVETQKTIQSNAKSDWPLQRRLVDEIDFEFDVDFYVADLVLPDGKSAKNAHLLAKKNNDKINIALKSDHFHHRSHALKIISELSPRKVSGNLDYKTEFKDRPVSLQSNFQLLDNQLSLYETKGMFEGERFEGVVTMDLSASKPYIDADMVLGHIDLNEHGVAKKSSEKSLLTSPTVTTSAWSREALPLKWLDKFNGRLHTVTQSLKYDRHQLENVDVILSMQDGEIKPLNVVAKFYKGNIELQLNYGLQEGQKMWTLLGGTKNVNLSGLFDVKGLTGRLDSQFNLTAQGQSVYDFVSTLNGEGILTAKQGTIPSLGLDSIDQKIGALKDIKILGNTLSDNLNQGTTKFYTLTLPFRVKQGVVQNQGDIRAESSSLLLQQGLVFVNLPKRQLDVRADIAFKRKPQYPPVGIRYSGSFDNYQKELRFRQLENYIKKHLYDRLRNKIKDLF